MCLEPFLGVPRLEKEVWLRGGTAAGLSHWKPPRSVSVGVACYQLSVLDQWFPHFGLWISGYLRDFSKVCK